MLVESLPTKLLTMILFKRRLDIKTTIVKGVFVSLVGKNFDGIMLISYIQILFSLLTLYAKIKKKDNYFCSTCYSFMFYAECLDSYLYRKKILYNIFGKIKFLTLLKKIIRYYLWQNKSIWIPTTNILCYIKYSS